MPPRPRYPSDATPPVRVPPQLQAAAVEVYGGTTPEAVRAAVRAGIDLAARVAALEVALSELRAAVADLQRERRHRRAEVSR